MSEESSKTSYSWLDCSTRGVQRNECSFTWTIENFSFLTQKIGATIQSDKFLCCESSNCSWSMQLNPMGRSAKDQNLAWLFLNFIPEDDTTAYVDYKFSLRSINNKDFCQRQGNYSFKKAGDWGHQLMKFEEIRRKLANDVLKIHVELTVFIHKDCTLLKNRDKVTNFSSTRTVFEKHAFRWNTTNFLNLGKLDQRSVSSPLYFPDDNLEWQWRLTLRAEPGKDKTADTLFTLKLISEEQPDDIQRPLQYNILVKNSRNELFKTFSNKLVFSYARELHTIGKEKELRDHFKDGILRLQVAILAPTHTENYRTFTVVSHEQNCRITDDFAAVFESGEHSDMIIAVQGRRIPVHKVILIARSSVFRSMLQHDTLEKQESKIQIWDLNFETMMHVLRFMYTNKLTAQDDASVIEILKAAEKYQIDQLKKMCEEYLIVNLNTSNVSDILACAETHQASSLADEALNFRALYSDDFISSFSSMEIKTT